MVLSSDLRRAAQTAEIAFGESPVPVLLDWRLRECNYGDLNGSPSVSVHAAVNGVNDRYPGGESWAEAADRVGAVLDDIVRRWPRGRVLVIGHLSVYWTLEHRVNEVPLDPLGHSFVWREGWEYLLAAP